MGKKYLPKPTEVPGAEIPRRVFSSPPLEIHLSRSADQFECIKLQEPELVFGENHRCVDPRTGLAAYGLFSNAGGTSSGQLRVGIVGTGECIEKTLSLLRQISKPIEQDPKLDSVLHPSFPGLNSGKPFSVDLVTQPSWHRSVNAEALRLAEDCSDSIEKFGMLRELFGEQVRVMGNLELPPDLVICAIPARLERALLNAACTQSLPTEILCDGKIPETDGPRQDKATQAWDLTVRLLFKAGLTPWRLADAVGDSCFVGITFCREAEGASPNRWTSFAHMVTDFGQGFLLKGDMVEWSSTKETKESPHLEKDQAATLMSRIIEAYGKHAGHLPRKVVVHKASPYSEGERLGFGDSLDGIKRHALVSVSRSGVFFLRPGRQPVFRGTAIPFGEKLGLVYVSGYIPFLRCYPGNEMPQPFEITENWGSLTFQEAAEDLLRLTKLDWRTSSFCSEVPATLAISERAYEIFRSFGQQGSILDDRSYL